MPDVIRGADRLATQSVQITQTGETVTATISVPAPDSPATYSFYNVRSCSDDNQGRVSHSYHGQGAAGAVRSLPDTALEPELGVSRDALMHRVSWQSIAHLMSIGLKHVRMAA